jgi:DNA ligase (NAD+)
VVAGENMGPAKLEKANQLKIPIISEDDFIQLVNES